VKKELDLDRNLTEQLDSLPISDKKKQEIKENKVLVVKNVVFRHEYSGSGESQSFEIEREWESSGTMRYYGLAGPMLSAISENKSLFIDELDSSLHPDLMKHFVLT